MKNKSLNGLVAVILGILFLTETYISICLTIYGLWLADKVLKNKENKEKVSKIVATVTLIIGYPIVVIGFIIFFKSL